MLVLHNHLQNQKVHVLSKTYDIRIVLTKLRLMKIYIFGFHYYPI